MQKDEAWVMLCINDQVILENLKEFKTSLDKVVDIRKGKCIKIFKVFLAQVHFALVPVDFLYQKFTHFFRTIKKFCTIFSYHKKVDLGVLRFTMTLIFQIRANFCINNMS